MLFVNLGDLDGAELVRYDLLLSHRRGGGGHVCLARVPQSNAVLLFCCRFQRHTPCALRFRTPPPR